MIKVMKRYRVNMLVQKQHWFWREDCGTSEFDISAANESAALAKLACMVELLNRTDPSLKKLRCIPLAAWEI